MTLDPQTMANRRWRRVAEMAKQLSQEAGPHLPSPCQSVCVMHPQTGWCEGCMRSLEEIAQWSRMDHVAKRAVWGQLPARLVQRLKLEDLSSGTPNHGAP